MGVGMLKAVITTGQSGGELGAWDAAKQHGIDVTGWMPKGWTNATGTHEEYADLYNAIESRYEDHKSAIWTCVQNCDAVLLLSSNRRSESSFTVRRYAELRGKPLAIYDPAKSSWDSCADSLSKLIAKSGPLNLLVISHRDEKYYDLVLNFMNKVFDRMNVKAKVS